MKYRPLHSNLVYRRYFDSDGKQITLIKKC